MAMQNLKLNFDKILNICKLNSEGLVNELGNPFFYFDKSISA